MLILKCILFTFRRDTHEIFAEPVDPNEVCICLLVPLILYMDAAISTILFNILTEVCVLIKAEDYYEIIEEPMDFGTMRAKLHEGMYRSLEQFEVCLLLQNYISELNMKAFLFFFHHTPTDNISNCGFVNLKIQLFDIIFLCNVSGLARVPFSCCTKDIITNLRT